MRSRRGSPPPCQQGHSLGTVPPAPPVPVLSPPAGLRWSWPPSPLRLLPGCLLVRPGREKPSRTSAELCLLGLKAARQGPSPPTNPPAGASLLHQRHRGRGGSRPSHRPAVAHSRTQAPRKPDSLLRPPWHGGRRQGGGDSQAPSVLPAALTRGSAGSCLLPWPQSQGHRGLIRRAWEEVALKGPFPKCWRRDGRAWGTEVLGAAKGNVL